jgi:hypothetical protein
MLLKASGATTRRAKNRKIISRLVRGNAFNMNLVTHRQVYSVSSLKQKRAKKAGRRRGGSEREKEVEEVCMEIQVDLPNKFLSLPEHLKRSI